MDISIEACDTVFIKPHGEIFVFKFMRIFIITFRVVYIAILIITFISGKQIMVGVKLER